MFWDYQEYMEHAEKTREVASGSWNGNRVYRLRKSYGTI